MFRTKKFRQDIISTAKKHPKFWRIYFNIGIITSFFLAVFGIIFVINNALMIYSGFKASGLSLVLPFPTSSFSVQPGLILVPPWHWIIGIAIIIFPHEISHGIALALNKLRIKSLGAFLFFFILPGAFVEPDEKQLKRAEKLKKLQVYVAGSFSNIVVGLMFVLIFNLTLSSLYEVSGIYESHYTFPTTLINISDIQDKINLSTGFVELQSSNKTYLATNYILKLQENKTQIRVYEDWPAIRSHLSGNIKKIDNQVLYSVDDIASILSKHKP
jgi:hypothetical protein